MKLLEVNFPGNRRTKIGDIFGQIFATLFTHVGETFRQSFALGFLASFLRRGIGVRVNGVTGRDAIVHKR